MKLVLLANVQCYKQNKIMFHNLRHSEPCMWPSRQRAPDRQPSLKIPQILILLHTHRMGPSNKSDQQRPHPTIRATLGAQEHRKNIV